jgi:aryl-alcohol dehydrogenase-like predicted oxidoreductase
MGEDASRPSALLARLGHALVKTSIDGGINFSDAAENYTKGESEKNLGTC